MSNAALLLAASCRASIYLDLGARRIVFLEVKSLSPVRFCRDRVRQLQRVIRFIRLDSRQNSRTNIGLLRKGFFSFRSVFYPLHEYDLRWFLNDWAIENHFARLNPPEVQAQLQDKLYFHLLLRHFGLGHKAAPLIGILVNGLFTSFSEDPTMEAAIARYGRVIAKPVGGLGGKGVELLQSAEKLPSHGTYVVEAALKQHSYAATLFPGSVNTMRVMTLRSGPSEAPFILGVGHRFGVASSAPVDNFSRGGIVAFVDVETGALTAARSAPGKYANNIHTHHPDTGAPFVGTIVPMWNEVKAFALELATAIPGLKLAGWDICVTEDGPRLIEGNGSVPNPELIQAHWPVLLNAQARRFFAEQGVISHELANELDQLAASEKLKKTAPFAKT